MRVDVAGVQVDNVTKQEALDRIRDFARSGQPHYAVTVYSEFVVAAQANLTYRQVLNSAHLSLADGVGILWAAKFLSLPKSNPVVTVLNFFGTLASVVLAPASIRSVIREQVTGSRLAWDIAALAEKENFTIALYGGMDGAAEKTAGNLKGRFPNLKVTLAQSDAPFDQAAVQKIASSNSDILLVAYQPPEQEMWIAQNINQFNVKFAIGLGGTFDYISGQKAPAPQWMHRLGLEWLWRLVTQPYRLARIWRALPVFSYIILRHKLRA